MSDNAPKNLSEVMALVAADAHNDAMALDGKPFDGRSVGENFGQVYASLATLARTVGVLCAREGL